MKFAEALRVFPTILENGPLTTRLVYDYGYKEGAFNAISDSKGQKALTKIYQDDIAIARAYHLPIIINAPTFRASRNHLPPTLDVKEINLACLAFVNKIKASYNNISGAPIFIGAPIGSMYDAYSVEAGLTIEEAKNYHQQQINVFKRANVDLIYALTISSLNEAMGIALASQESNLDYTVGFILNEEAKLLDGTPLHEAIKELDAANNKKPLGYLITCTHASIVEKLGNKQYPEYQRLIGAQMNGSHLSLQQLEKMTVAVADSPKKFADDIQRIKAMFGLTIVAGCCGTTKEHLQAIAEKFGKRHV